MTAAMLTAVCHSGAEAAAGGSGLGGRMDGCVYFFGGGQGAAANRVLGKHERKKGGQGSAREAKQHGEGVRLVEELPCCHGRVS